MLRKPGPLKFKTYIYNKVVVWFLLSHAAPFSCATWLVLSIILPCHIVAARCKFHPCHCGTAWLLKRMGEFTELSILCSQHLCITELRSTNW